ncbi:HEAT repeat domain-containing protein [Actinacidiphila sp. bgisy167]|uniref:HEAT repeat domain-containing protein n=1 Tax=Actinacidiphila sp. bgisy167 TaxID=3413797 RepID=UPI003D734819
MSANDATAALPEPAALLLETDWSDLAHAYGPADGTPDDLLGLLHDDPEVQAESLGRLEMSVLHQGSLYSATPPAALFVAGILSDPRTLAVHEGFFPWDDRVGPLRAALLEWLGELAESAAYEDEEEDDEDDGEEWAEEIAATEACRAVRPQLFDAVALWLDDADGTVREAALGAVTHLLRAPELADRLPAAADRLERIARGGGDRRERAGALLSLGAWGHDTVGFLTDPDPAVRACAALGTTGPGAVPALLDALGDPAAADAWFGEPLPQFDGWFRFTLLRGLLDRAQDFEQVLPAALALVPMCSQYTVDSDWGPLLASAFPLPYAPGRPLTGAQRAFLQALSDQDDCWGNVANRVSWLRSAGLPTERDPLRALLVAAPTVTGGERRTVVPDQPPSRR